MELNDQIKIYRQRNPKTTSLWKLLNSHFDEFEACYETLFQKEYGFYRLVIPHVVRKYLECGDLHQGFGVSYLAYLPALNALIATTNISWLSTAGEDISDGMRNRYSNNIHQDASNPSVFDLFNVTYTGVGEAVPWRHLASDGLAQRNGNSYVGQMWIGGGAARGVWHSEYKCLQNGRHHNYHHRTDESRGYANLRTHDRYCLWCEEIITIRILEKTGAFYRSGDPLDDTSIVELGSMWYRRWEDGMRPVYWTQFSIDQRIVNRETWYQDPANLQNSAWNGDLRGTNLIREITEKPHRGMPSILLT